MQLFRRFTGLREHRPAPSVPRMIEGLESRTLLSVVPRFIEAEFASGLRKPTAMVVAPDGRVFVAEQEGDVRVITPQGELLDDPFISIETDDAGERGIIGITLDPQFDENGFVYVYYTVPETPRFNRVDRITADGNTAAAGSLRPLFDLDPLSSATNHNGGAMHFGGDGKLYVAVGENANPPLAQSLNTVHGKMLRLNADGSIPSDNPFFDQLTGNNRAIWALGLRNPFTFAVQPGTGRMFINDVGQSSFEEINEGVAGANYGWPQIEGKRDDQPAPENYRDPVHAYGRDVGAVITGGVFYNPPAGAGAALSDDFTGDYLFADMGSGVVRRLDPSTGETSGFITDFPQPVDLDLAPDGTLYVASYREGLIRAYRPAQVQQQPPAIAQQPENRSVAVGQPVTFEVAAAGEGQFTYQWQRDEEPINGATGASFTLPAVTLEDDGAQFRVIVSNEAGSTPSSAATLTVTTTAAPVATITSPTEGTTFAAGDTISYSGEASDAEGAALPTSAFSWRVDYHTGGIVRPFVPETPGAREGTFVVPTVTPYTAPDVFYRIHLTVTDDGQTTTVSRDVQPRTATFRLQSSTEGIGLTLDGQPIASGEVVTSVVGLSRIISAPEQAELNGVTYEFVNWSDGGAPSHSIAAPASDSTFIATYRPIEVGSGGGVLGTYFDNPNFTGPSVSRIDPAIDFDFGKAAPDPAIAPRKYSARWTATLTPQVTEEHTFFLTAAGGARLLLDGEPLVDRLRARRVDAGATVALEAGRDYQLQVEYAHRRGSGSVRLRWSTLSTPMEVVPTARLSPPVGAGITTDLLPTQDTYVQSGRRSGRNFGSARQLRVASSEKPNATRESFLTFDLASVGAFESAKLTLTGRMTGRGAGEMNVGVFAVEDTTWDAAALTFDTRPATGTTPLETLTVTRGRKAAYEVDLTAYLLAQQAAGRTNVSIALKSLTPDGVFTISSGESSKNAPTLTVTSGV